MLNVKLLDSTIRLNNIVSFERAKKTKNKYTPQYSLGLWSCIWGNHNTSGTMTFGHTRPNWRDFAIMHSAIFGEDQTLHSSTNTISYWSSLIAFGQGETPTHTICRGAVVVEGWWFEIILQAQNLGTLTMNSSVYQRTQRSQTAKTLDQMLSYNRRCNCAKNLNPKKPGL